MKYLFILTSFFFISLPAISSQFDDSLLDHSWDGPKSLLKEFKKSKQNPCVLIAKFEKKYKDDNNALRRLMKTMALTKCKGKGDMVKRHIETTNIPLLYDTILLAASLNLKEKTPYMTKVRQIQKKYPKDQLIKSGVKRFFNQR